jgi:DNA-binding NarL/FixJ family response regulator
VGRRAGPLAAEPREQPDQHDVEGHEPAGSRSIDLRAGPRSALEATRRLAQAGLRARVLVLTTFELDQHVYDALQAGASGFLLKDVDRERLVDAVRTVRVAMTRG